MFGEIGNQVESVDDEEALPPRDVTENKKFFNEHAREDSKLSDEDDDEEPGNDYQVLIYFYGNLIHKSYTILLIWTFIFNQKTM